MSRWLKSVNNILENLDGTAETVAEQGGAMTAAVASNVTAGLMSRVGNNDNEDDDYYTDDDDVYSEYEEDDDYDSNEEDDADIPPPKQVVGSLRPHTQSSSKPPLLEAENTGNRQTAKAEAQRRSADSVSELSFSEAYEDEDSSSFQDAVQTESGSDAAAAAAVAQTKASKMDESPRQPKRTFEAKNKAMKDALPNLMGDDPQTHPGLESSVDSSGAVDPPKPPVRKSSASQQTESRVVSSTNVVASDAKNQEMSAATTRQQPEQQPMALASNVSSQSQVQPPKPPPSQRSANKNQTNRNINVNAAYAAATNKVQSLQIQLSKLQKELESTQTRNQTLENKVESLEKTVAASEQEIEAQAKELQRAGQEMENIRKTAKEDHEDILDDHEIELEDLQKEHQAELDKMRQDYETTIAQWKEQFEREQSQRQQEGGNWNQELEDAVQRERDALTKLHAVTSERDELKSKVEKKSSHSSELQTKLEAAIDASKAAAAREKQAQDELDVSKASHSRQILQRQRREAELEQTIAELGSALTMAKQQSSSESGDRKNTSSQSQNVNASDEVKYKEQWEQATEEVETLRVQLTMETQRRQALDQELQEIAQERTEEAAREQSHRAQNDRKVSELEATVSRLQASLRSQQVSSSTSKQLVESSHLSEQQLAKKLDEAKREIAKLSDQLLRHQGLTENAKSEISALKARLQVAVARAEEAEKVAFQKNNFSHNGSAYDMERGGRSTAFTTRRRIKGGGTGRTGVRSIRSALRLGSSSSSSPALNQIVQTIDAVDGWMVDTGAFMRTEPLARLGFLLYLMILHIWSFALVLFHNVEVEHGDFGSMDSNPRHWRSH